MVPKNACLRGGNKKKKKGGTFKEKKRGPKRKLSDSEVKIIPMQNINDIIKKEESKRKYYQQKRNVNVN